VTTGQILIIAAVTNVVLIVTLALSTALIKLWRKNRERLRERELTGLRPVLLEYLASWEDGDARDLADTLIGHHSRSATFEELVAGLLPKLRGADRSVLVDILRRRGTIEQACKGTQYRTSLRRAMSAELLGSAGAIEGIPFVTRLLEDRNPQVRLAAVRALGRIGTSESASALITQLDRKDSGIAPQPVTMALLRMGMDAAGPLRGALDANRTSVRTMAAEALGVLEVFPARSALERMLRTDPELSVRVGAAHALGRLGMPGSVDVLVQALKTEHGIDVLAAVCTSLGLIAGPQAVPALAWATGHEAPPVRVAAAQALIRIPNEGLERLRAIAEDPLGGDAAREVLARHVVIEAEKFLDEPVQLQFRF
jgi:HEAT repeat protein